MAVSVKASGMKEYVVLLLSVCLFTCLAAATGNRRNGSCHCAFLSLSGRENGNTGKYKGQVITDAHWKRCSETVCRIGARCRGGSNHFIGRNLREGRDFSTLVSFLPFVVFPFSSVALRVSPLSIVFHCVTLSYTSHSELVSL